MLRHLTTQGSQASTQLAAWRRVMLDRGETLPADNALSGHSEHSARLSGSRPVRAIQFERTRITRTTERIDTRAAVPYECEPHARTSASRTSATRRHARV